jgi:hypothetical protein
LKLVRQFNIALSSVASNSGEFEIPPELHTKIMKKKSSVGPLGLEILDIMGEPTKYGSIANVNGLTCWDRNKFQAAVKFIQKYRPDVSEDLIKKTA